MKSRAIKPYTLFFEHKNTKGKCSIYIAQHNTVSDARRAFRRHIKKYGKKLTYAHVRDNTTSWKLDTKTSEIYEECDL